MSQSDTRMNKPSAKASRDEEEEKRVRCILNALAARPNLNEETMASLVEMDPKSDIAKRIACFDKPSNVELTMIIKHHEGSTQLAARQKVKAEKHTTAYGRVFSCIKNGMLFTHKGGVLSIKKKDYDIFLSIRNEADTIHHDINSHNTLMAKAGFERVYRDDDGNVIGKDVYAWTHKDKSFDLSNPSHAAKISVGKHTSLGKGKGKGSLYSKEEHRSMAVYMKENVNKKMSKLTDDEANAIAPGRFRTAVLGQIKRAFGSTMYSKASKHPNFDLALQGKELVFLKGNKYKAKKTASGKENADPEEEKEEAVVALELSAENESDTKLPADNRATGKANGKSKGKANGKANGKNKANGKSKGKDKSSTATRRTSSSKVPAEGKDKAASNGSAKKRTKIAVLGDESESECENQPVAPTKKFRSSAQYDIRCMEENAAEDEKVDFELSDHESDDDE